MTITLTGFMGSGKTTVGKLVAGRLGWEFFDLDAYLEHKWGESVPKLFENGETWFRAAEAEALRDLVIMGQVSGSDRVIALGGGTLSIPVLKDYILENTTCIYLRLSLEEALSRVKDSTRPMLKLSSPSELYASRVADYEMAAHTVVSGGRSPEEIAEEVAGLI